MFGEFSGDAVVVTASSRALGHQSPRINLGIYPEQHPLEFTSLEHAHNLFFISLTRDSLIGDQRQMDGWVQNEPG